MYRENMDKEGACRNKDDMESGETGSERRERYVTCTEETLEEMEKYVDNRFDDMVDVRSEAWKMDCLECKICNIQYDEEDHRPRNAPCGHTLCSLCIRALIKDNIFECPKCRHKHNVNIPDDLPVNFGLIDVIREFKPQNNYLPKQTECRISGGSKNDECKVHHKIITHRCWKCERWICEDCLISHTTLTGCTTAKSHTAMKSLRCGYNKGMEMLISQFDDHANTLLSKIQNHDDKIKEITNKKKEIMERAEKQIKELSMHAEEQTKEIKKIRLVLQQGYTQKEKAVESKIHLSDTNSPFTFMDRVEVLEEMKQTLRSWCITNNEKHFPDNIQHLISKGKDWNKASGGDDCNAMIETSGSNDILTETAHDHSYRPVREDYPIFDSFGEDSRRKSYNPDSRQVFVGNIPHSTTEEELMKGFSRFGNIVDVRIIIERREGQYRPNFGFITFGDETSVNEVLSNRPIILNGDQCLNVERKKIRSFPRFNEW